MKTQTQNLRNLLKKIVITSFVMVILVSCGKQNSTNNNNPNRLNSFGNVIGANGQVVNASAVVNVIRQLNPCSVHQNFNQFQNQNNQFSNGQAVRMIVPIQGYGRVFKPTIGITTEGDIATISSNGGQTVLEILACPRDFATNQAQLTLIQDPISESFCPVDGLVANVQVPGQFRMYGLNFFPITVAGNIAQQICR